MKLKRKKKENDLAATKHVADRGSLDFHSSVIRYAVKPGSYRYSQKSSDPLSAPDVS